MKTKYFIGLLTALAMAAPALAEEPELHISSKGEVRITNTPITTRHSINLISVVVWGIRWTVPVDQYTRVQSADGKDISFSDVRDDHRLEIVGQAVIGDIRRQGWLDTKLVRDLSIGNAPSSPPSTSSGQAPSTSSQAPAPSPAPLPAPSSQQATIASAITPPQTPPAPAPAPSPNGKRLLTQKLRLGMRGGEVIILQEFLQKNGWGIPDDGPVTGYFGKVTVNAVKKFQAANGIAPEGEVGPKTRSAINAFLQR